MPFQKGNQLSKQRKWKKHSDESRAKMREASGKKDKSFYKDPERNRKISESRMGSKHPLWKGDNAKKGGSFHEWVRRRLDRPEKCQACGQIPKPRKDGKFALDLANKSGDYLRDLSDWEWLCKKCHMRKDGISKRLREFGKKKLYVGKNSPNWRGGPPKCLDCGTPTNSSSYKAKRCRPCYLKLKTRGKRGEHSSSI